MALADPQRIEALDPFDPLQLDAELSEEERMVRDTARAYAEGELLPRVTSAFLDERFPATSGRKWARSACSVRRSIPNMAARG